MSRQQGTISSGLPRFHDAGGESALLLIHGFGSYPGVMDELAGQVRDIGISVSVPRLPGHGTCSEDFVASRGRDWYRRVLDEYFDLRGNYRRLFVSGLSLGGILALMLAGAHRIEGLILMAPAVLNTNRFILFAPVARHFIRSVANTCDPQGQDMSDPDVRYLADEYWSRRWIGPAAEVLRVQRASRRALRRVSAPCFTIVSERDTTVPPTVARYIERRIASTAYSSVVLKESKHQLVTDCEKEEVNRLVVEKLRSWTE